MAHTVKMLKDIVTNQVKESYVQGENVANIKKKVAGGLDSLCQKEENVLVVKKKVLNEVSRRMSVVATGPKGL